MSEPVFFLRALEKLKESKASDIHISRNGISLRVRGEIVKLQDIKVSKDDTLKLFEYLLSRVSVSQKESIISHLNEYDNAGFSVTENISGVNMRFRVNVSRHDGGFYFVFRSIKETPPDLDELGFNEKVRRGLERLSDKVGLFLVTGPTGSGKSTTLASIVSHIASKKNFNVITLEDPIEYVYSDKNYKAQIIQKELGRDFSRFADGLHSALREDPDVILVGEIRDQKTLDLSLKASETGHLVLSTLHTNDSVSAIQRICSMSENERFARDRLSQSLLGILAQRLLRRKDGERELVYEVFFVNKAVSNLIREGKDAQIRALIDTLEYSQSFKKTVLEKKSLLTEDSIRVVLGIGQSILGEEKDEEEEIKNGGTDTWVLS